MPHSRVLLILALIISFHSAMALLSREVFNINYEILADDAHPDKCVINTTKGQTIVDSFQSVHHPTKCAQVDCGKDGWALVYTCYNADPPEECVDVYFPQCCEMSDMCNDV